MNFKTGLCLFLLGFFISCSSYENSKNKKEDNSNQRPSFEYGTFYK
jgi:hypothetical protein